MNLNFVFFAVSLVSTGLSSNITDCLKKQFISYQIITQVTCLKKMLKNFVSLKNAVYIHIELTIHSLTKPLTASLLIYFFATCSLMKLFVTACLV